MRFLARLRPSVSLETDESSHDNCISVQRPSCLLSSEPKILYCRCAFAKVVPDGTKNEVLNALSDSGASFECVPDLCEMSARKDPRLAELIDGDGEVRIAACYPRAVKWLFHSAGSPFPDEDRIEVLNMRDTSASEVISSLLDS